MTEIKYVAIVGALGKMGQVVLNALNVLTSTENADLKVATEIVDDGTFERQLLLDKNDNLLRITPRNSGGNTDIVIEFSVAGQSFANVKTILENGNCNVVVGTSGWKDAEISRLREWVKINANNAKVLIVPNFSVSAVLQAKWAKEAANYFQDIHILEYHHKAKLDKPSGTALNLQDNLESITGSRPEALSVRADGYMATQEVILTNNAERLKIEQDVTAREAFVPGILLALRKVSSLKPGVYVGLEVVM